MKLITLSLNHQRDYGLFCIEGCDDTKTRQIALLMELEEGIDFVEMVTEEGAILQYDKDFYDMKKIRSLYKNLQGE